MSVKCGQMVAAMRTRSASTVMADTAVPNAPLTSGVQTVNLTPTVRMDAAPRTKHMWQLGTNLPSVEVAATEKVTIEMLASALVESLRSKTCLHWELANQAWGS
jgi:hypothetical protein